MIALGVLIISSPQIFRKSLIPSSRYVSTWISLQFSPSYSLTNLKVGETIDSKILSPSAKPWANVVFPEPRLPIKATTVPISNFFARFFA